MIYAICVCLLGSDNAICPKLGEIGNDFKNVSFAYSFDKIAIVSNGKLFYWQDAGNVFLEVTDPDLGIVESVIWVDGYFVLNDNEFVVVTELNDPTSIDPFKYGSSEINPDPIVAMLKLKNEIVALNRHTIEFFSNAGGSGFPFQRIDGASVNRGCIEKYACCVYNDTITFLGGALNEQLSIYQAVNGQSVKVSTKEIDDIINGYTTEHLKFTQLETILYDSDLLLFVHFYNATYVYNITASKSLGFNAWSKSDSNAGYYDAWNFTYCFDKLICGRRSNKNLGYVNQDVATHWGNKINWEFQTDILFNEANNAIIHEMEFQHQVKTLPLNSDAYICTDFSFDGGVTYSQEKYLNIGRSGRRIQRMRFLRNGQIKNKRIQRFKGDSDSHLALSRLDIKAEPLAW